MYNTGTTAGTTDCTYISALVLSLTCMLCTRTLCMRRLAKHEPAHTNFDKAQMPAPLYHFDPSEGNDDPALKMLEFLGASSAMDLRQQVLVQASAWSTARNTLEAIMDEFPQSLGVGALSPAVRRTEPLRGACIFPAE